MAGAEPVFCDVDADSFCMNAETINKAITPTVKAIMPVGIYGNSPDMDEICSVAKSYKLKMIEDAAQDINVTWGDKHLGTFGDVGCMSFFSDKTITTSEGGMIFTDSDEMAEKAIMLMNQGRLKRGWYVHETIGYNFRLTDLGAAVGLAQLDKLPEIIEKKKAHEELYRDLLADVGQVEFPKIDKQCFNVPFRHNILVPDPKALSKYLAGLGIGNLRFFYPLHRQPCYKYLKYDDIMFPNTIKAYDRGLSLPSSVKLLNTEIAYICMKIKEFYEGVII
jgi:perosamine synthetase